MDLVTILRANPRKKSKIREYLERDLPPLCLSPDSSLARTPAAA